MRAHLGYLYGSRWQFDSGEGVHRTPNPPARHSRNAVESAVDQLSLTAQFLMCTLSLLEGRGEGRGGEGRGGEGRTGQDRTGQDRKKGRGGEGRAGRKEGEGRGQMNKRVSKGARNREEREG